VAVAPAPGVLDEPPVDLRQPEARAYRRAARRRRRAAFAVDMVLLVALALAAGHLARAGLPAALDAALLAALCGAALELAGIPFFVAGHRAAVAAGLSRQTLAGAALDRAKGLALGAAVVLPGAALLVEAQRRLPGGWPYAAWGVLVAFGLVVTVILPVVLLPIFLRSEPLPPGPLRASVDDLVAASGLVVRDVRLLRLGDKTSAGNAAVVGIGPTRRILVGDTLAGLDGEAADGPIGAGRLAETQAVLAHELGHHAHADLWRGLALGGVLDLVAWLAAAAVLARLPSALAHGGAGDPAALPALALAYGAVSAIIGLASSWHSRRMERAADAYAGRLADPAAFARALERLTASNLAELEPPWLERVRGSHPPTGERIAAAKEDMRAATRKPGG
jgi:Peptidase family M48/CAAX prenyl protease N-terminal, five membrane helices